VSRPLRCDQLNGDIYSNNEQKSNLDEEGGKIDPIIFEMLEDQIDVRDYSRSCSPLSSRVNEAILMSPITTLISPTHLAGNDPSIRAENRVSFSTRDGPEGGVSDPSLIENLKKKKYELLIVDDSRLNRKMLCRLFHTSGSLLHEAEDGLIALERVQARMSVATKTAIKDHYDAILMDFMMPNMDGPTATKAIRAMGYTAPIIGKKNTRICIHKNKFL
jgi:CheY-like chemotaxis protein